MLTLLGNIILLPLTYRFGYEKAKYVYYLCIGMLGGLMGITVSSGGILLNSILPAQGSLLVLVAVLAAVLALYASAGHCTDRSGAVLPLLAAVRCLVRKGRAVK